MPIAQTDQLYKLIKSLEKAEKRHFKLYVNRLDSNKNVMFIKLFDLMDKAKNFDENKIQSKFPKMKTADFSNLKRHLYSQILKSLRLIHSRHDTDIQVREQLDYAKILYGKGLHLQSLKILERIKPLAKASNQEILLLDILEFQKLIESRHITRSRNVKNKVENLIDISSRSHVTISRTSQVSNLSLMIQGLYIKMGFVKNDKEEFLVGSYFRSNLPKVLSSSPGFYEEVILHQSYVWYHYMMLDFESSLDRAISWIDAFDRNPVMQMKDPDLYLRGLHYVMTNNFYLNQPDDFDAWLMRFQKFSETNKHNFNDTTRVLNFIYGKNAEINYTLLHKDFGKAIDLEKSIMDDLPKFKLKLDSHRIKMFHYKFAWIRMSVGEYQIALDHLNYIIQPKMEHLRSDLYCYSRLLSLICNYHLKNYALVKNLSIGVRRSFEISGETSSVSNAILAFLNKHPDNFSLSVSTEKLNDKIQRTLNDKFEKRIFNYFNFKDWVTSLRENVTIAEVYEKT